MSVEYDFYPVKNNRIVGGFSRSEEGTFDYCAPMWSTGGGTPFYQLEKRRLSPEDIHPLDQEFLVYPGWGEEQRPQCDVYFIDRKFIEEMAEKADVSRGYVPRSVANEFANQGYPFDFLDDVPVLSAEAYAASAGTYDEPYVQVAYMDWQSVEFFCFRLEQILQAYVLQDPDGLFMVVG